LKFFGYSLSSAYELETQLLICKRRNYGNLPLLKNILTKIETEQKMLFGFIQNLEQNSK